MKHHRIKILPQYYKDITGISGVKKNFELRKNDRDYKVQDIVTFCEFDGEEYTGREITIEIKYLLKDCPQWGLLDGYCIFGW